MTSLTAGLSQLAPSVQPQIEAVQQAASLFQMILAAWRLGLSLARLVVQETIGERARQPTDWPPCPQCGTRLHSKGLLPRQLTTILGVLCWKRRVGRCPKGCPIEPVAPLDQAVGIEPNQQTSTELKQLACAFAVFVPFETAAALLRRATGISVSPAAVWNWVQAVGQTAMRRLTDELEKLAAGQNPEAEPLEAAQAARPLIIGADGVMVPFRPAPDSPKGKTKWREVKVAILARLKRTPSRDGSETTRLERRRLVAVLGDIDALAPRLWLEALRQSILTAQVVVWISDGGRGFWRLFNEQLAKRAIGILDFYHAAQNLWKAASAWLDGRTRPARQWFEHARHQLRHGQAEAVLRELETTLALNELPATARQALQQVYEYLKKHGAHLDYEKFKALGLPLGSGLVESACKWLIQQRFKGVGMRWSEEGFNHLLHLRLAWVNDRFDALSSPMPSPNS